MTRLQFGNVSTALFLQFPIFLSRNIVEAPILKRRLSDPIVQVVQSSNFLRPAFQAIHIDGLGKRQVEDSL